MTETGNDQKAYGMSWMAEAVRRSDLLHLRLGKSRDCSENFRTSISGLGGYTIAKQLNAKKVPAFGPSPKWDQSTIHYMLRNRATIGEHQPKRIRNGKRIPEGDPISNFYPAVIEESLFLAAQVARQKNLASGRGRKGRLMTNLFRGIPTCAYCASPVLFKSKSNVKSLVCSSVIENRGCFRFAWSYGDFERLFLDFVKNRESDVTTEQLEREALAELVKHIRDLSGSYDARMGIFREAPRTLSGCASALSFSELAIPVDFKRIRMVG